jgi:hypothetical protein
VRPKFVSWLGNEREACICGSKCNGSLNMLYCLGPVRRNPTGDECPDDHLMNSRKKVLARNQQEIVTYIRLPDGSKLGRNK